MGVDEKQSFQTFRKVGHCKLFWTIRNVYQCRKILNSWIDGPHFEPEGCSSFPWSLKLGQSKLPQRKGMSLSMKWALRHEESLVNFRVYVRKQTQWKPLLDETYQVMFHYGTLWESPLLATNDEFTKEVQNDKFCNSIEIVIESMWNEKAEPQRLRNQYLVDASSELLGFKEVGNDLRKFYRNSKFSDTYIKCANEEIPAHKAILEVRCLYFAQTIDSYTSTNWEGIDSTLEPTADIDVMNAFLMYLYTGDIESLMENGPLPVGIHKCAQRMRKFDLERLTAPLNLQALSELKYEQIGFQFNVDIHLRKLIHDGVESRVYRSKSFGNENMAFTIRIRCSKADNSKPYISVFLCLEQLKRGEKAYVLFDVSIKNGESDLIARKVVADLPLNSCIGFPEFISVNKLLEKPDTLFSFRVYRYLNELDTSIDIGRIDCKFQLDKRAVVSFPASELPGACHGWINLSCDLRHLLVLESYSDCIIIVDDGRLCAHRVILAARSPYFSTVLNAKEEECIGSSKGMEILVKKDVNIDVETMKIILEEIYTGCYRIRTVQSAKNIYNSAKFFGLRRLEIKCLKFIETDESDYLTCHKITWTKNLQSFKRAYSD